jgi:Aspartyl/Asparaginyl beta-hydroxylase
MSKFRDLVAVLDRIPHLDLQQAFDAGHLQAELAALPPEMFQPYRTVHTRYADLLAESWQGASLASPDASLHGDLTEYLYEPRVYQWTPLAVLCPYMTEVVRSLGGEAQRVRLMRIQPGGHLAWHRHGVEGAIDGEGLKERPNWSEVIVHVPIRTNPHFSYEVIPLASYQTADYLTERPRIHRKSYPEGDAWAFNGVNVHNVFNRSATEARYALMMDLDIRCKRTYDIVSAAVDSYDGPLMAPL